MIVTTPFTTPYGRYQDAYLAKEKLDSFIQRSYDNSGGTVIITISEEAKKMHEEVRQANIELLKDIYKSAGLSEPNIPEDGELSYLDKKLLELKFGGNNNANFELRLFNACNAYSTETIADISVMIAKNESFLENYFSDNEILKRIEALDVKNEADIEFLFNTAKAFSKEYVETVKEQQERTLQDIAEQMAGNVVGIFSGENGKIFDSSSSEVELLADNFKRLIKEQKDVAKQFIRVGITDIKSALKTGNLLNSKITFTFEGVAFSYKDLDATYKFLAEANQITGRIDSNKTWDDYSNEYNKLIKRGEMFSQGFDTKETTDKFISILENGYIKNAKDRYWYNINNPLNL